MKNKSSYQSLITSITSWILQVAAATLLIAAAFPKFTAEPASVALFTELGAEPFARISVGFIEVVAALFLLIPRTVIFGAGIGFVTMSGAIFSHLTILGISLGEEDGGSLFATAVIVLVATAALLYLKRKKATTFVAPLFSKA